MPLFNRISLALHIAFKGGDNVVDFVAYQIILGRRTFSECPAKLKEGVCEVLVANGLGHLADE